MTGDQLRAWREGRRWEVERAAASFRVDDATWRRWEGSTRSVPSFIADGIAYLTEVDRARERLNRIRAGTGGGGPGGEAVARWTCSSRCH